MDTTTAFERELLGYARLTVVEAPQLYLTPEDELVLTLSPGRGRANRKLVQDYVPGADGDGSHDKSKSFPYYVTNSRISLSKARSVWNHQHHGGNPLPSHGEETQVRRYGLGMQANDHWLHEHVPLRIKL